jgi:hypothetical protein
MRAAAMRAGSVTDALLAYLERAAEDRTGLRSTVAVAVACVVVALAGWIPLGFPAGLITSVVPAGECGAFDGALFALCSAKVAALTLAGPVAVLAVVFLLRRRIADIVKRNVARVPDAARFLVGPALATALFTMTWADAHDMPFDWALVPQILFPAVIGLFAWITARWNADAQRRLARFFDARDRLSRRRRFALAAAVPAVAGLVLGLDTANGPAKEQLVVLIGLASAYLALVPRSGDVMAAIEEAVQR